MLYTRKSRKYLLGTLEKKKFLSHFKIFVDFAALPLYVKASAHRRGLSSGHGHDPVRGTERAKYNPYENQYATAHWRGLNFVLGQVNLEVSGQMRPGVGTMF